MTAFPTLAPGLQEAQLRPSGASPVQLYTPLAWFRYPGVGTARPIGVLAFIAIANNTATEAKYTIYHDDDGTTYDETTIITGEDIPIQGEQTHFINLGIGFKSTAATIGVKTTVGNALTFTPYVSFPNG